MRLRTDIWIQALLRRVYAAGAYGAIVQKGEEQAGAMLIKIAPLDGTAWVLSGLWSPEGEREWMTITGPAPVPESEADALLKRQAARDPDIWIVEIEDRQGRHFLDEKVQEPLRESACSPKPLP